MLWIPECGILLWRELAVSTAYSQNSWLNWASFNKALAEFIRIPFCWGEYGIVNCWTIPLLVQNVLNFLLLNSVPLSVRIKDTDLLKIYYWFLYTKSEIYRTFHFCCRERGPIHNVKNHLELRGNTYFHELIHWLAQQDPCGLIRKWI